MKPQATAQHIRAREKNTWLPNPRLVGPNTFFQGRCQSVMLFSSRAVEAVQVRQTVIQYRGSGGGIILQFRHHRLSGIQQPLQIPLHRVAIHGDGCVARVRPLVRIGQPIHQRLRDQDLRLVSGQLFLPAFLPGSLH